MYLGFVVLKLVFERQFIFNLQFFLQGVEVHGEAVTCSHSALRFLNCDWSDKLCRRRLDQLCVDPMHWLCLHRDQSVRLNGCCSLSLSLTARLGGAIVNTWLLVSIIDMPSTGLPNLFTARNLPHIGKV